MKLFLTCFLLFSILSTQAQDTALKRDDGWKIFNLEIIALYPGGYSAWQGFLDKNLRYPRDAVTNNIQADVVVQFIVDSDGTTSDFSAISGPEKGGFREEAIRLIRLSGIWQPMIRNHHKIKSFRKQKLSFRLLNGQPRIALQPQEDGTPLLYTRTTKIA